MKPQARTSGGPSENHAGRAAARSALAALAAASVLAGCPGAPKAVVYDLARRAPVAERWSAREVLLFGTPAVEPFLPEGFYREAGAGGEPFLWSKGESEVALGFDTVTPRAVVLDLQPYQGVRDQRLLVRLNGTDLEELKLGDVRSRYRVALPVAAQKVGENRLRFVFAATAAPSDQDPKAQDQRQLAAAFYSLTLGARRGCRPRRSAAARRASTLRGRGHGRRAVAAPRRPRARSLRPAFAGGGRAPVHAGAAAMPRGPRRARRRSA